MKPLEPFDVSFAGIHLIEASAGTGKTYNIASLYIRAIIEERKTVDQILVVTYTEAATKELRDRLIKRLRQARQALEETLDVDQDSFLVSLVDEIDEKEPAINLLDKAIHSFDEAAVYTIHGFCRHVLQEQAFESGASFEVELIGDDSELVEDIVADYWRSSVSSLSDNEDRRPLLKLLIDKGYRPGKLADQLSPYTGKPYLNVSPPQEQLESFEEKLDELAGLFKGLRDLWDDCRTEVRELLLSEPMTGVRFRASYLDNWMPAMQRWLDADMPPIVTFDKFSRFSQSYVNESLKKSSVDKGISPPQHAFFKAVDEYMGLAEELQSYQAYFQRELFTFITEQLEQRKEEQQGYSYDDLLVHLHRALNHPERGEALRQTLRQSYPVALVDEFQDTDPIQYQIFKAIYAGAQEAALFMIGDPKQSIYSFRGADIFSYLQAKKDAPAEQTYHLKHNFRSVPSLLEGVNKLFGFKEAPFILENIDYEPVLSGGLITDAFTEEGQEVSPLEIRKWPETEEKQNKGPAKEMCARETALQIHQLLAKAGNGNALIGDEAVRAQDIAVIVRSHRQADLMNHALGKKGIKSVQNSRASVFDSGEATELYTILKAVVEPDDERLVRAALSTTVLAYKADELYEMQENETQWAAKLQDFVKWHEIWLNRGVGRMFRRLMQEEKVAASLMEQLEGERTLTNLLHLAELLQQKEQEQQTGMHALLKWLLKKQNNAQKDVEEEQLRLESDENLVRIVTMHHSKGLEYPIVFCPFLWDAPQLSDDGSPLSYHDPANHDKVYLDFWGKNDPEREEKRFLQAQEQLAESVRLAYVAMTRAKYKCVMHWSFAGKPAHSPLGTLLTGKEEAFKSLKGSVFSDVDYDLDASLINEALAQLAEHPSIEMITLRDDESSDKDIAIPARNISLKASQFNRGLPLPQGDEMTSFSALAHGGEDDYQPDYQQYYDALLSDEQDPERGKASVFSFPRGAGPGTAVHHMFEELDFSDESQWDAKITPILESQNIHSRWAPVARKMIQRTLSKSLHPELPGLKLQALQADQLIAEMAFYFKTGNIELADLMSIIRPKSDDEFNFDNFAREGFLKGFIDLTFQFEGRYFILDYKTNHLGNTVDDYRPSNLETEMNKNIYDLQYHLYLVALHRFLNNNLTDYRYETHLGGAFYLFVRGMNEDGPEGIFFDRPEKKTITKLDHYLNAERS